MNEQNKVTLKIESSVLGHETAVMELHSAAQRVQDEVSNQGKWLYCDGRLVMTDSVDSKDLESLKQTLASARDVTLTSQLKGG